jgi:hypothetical protein
VLKQVTRSGMPLVTQTTSVLNPDMEGMMADVVQGLLDAAGLGGQQHTKSEVTRVTTSDLPAELFYNNRLPAGYTLRTPR